MKLAEINENLPVVRGKYPAVESVSFPIKEKSDLIIVGYNKLPKILDYQ